MQHLVYLHGFLSSPQSAKAQQTITFAKKHYPFLNLHVPQLSGNIDKAVSAIDNLVASLPINRVGFIGSSMGGFLSTYCIEKYGPLGSCCKAVIVNPAVEPFNLLVNYTGKHINPYTQEVFYVQKSHINKLKALNVSKLKRAQAYKVLLQTGDETLDYRLALRKYKGSAVSVELGGDHSFVGYEKHLPSIFEFLLSK